MVYDVNYAVIGLPVAALIVGLAAAVGTTISSIVTSSNNRKAQEDTNAQQLSMFEAANAFNRQERLETQQFNASQIQEERAYNDPALQSQRLGRAGLNAGAILDGDIAQTLGHATSSPSSSASTPSLLAPQSSPVDFSGLSDSFMNYAQFDQLQTDTALKKEDLKYKNVDQLLNLSERIAKIDNTLSDSKLKADQRLNLIDERNNLGVVYKSLLLQYNRDFKASQFDDSNNKAINDINLANALKATRDQKHQDFMYNLEEYWAPKMKKKDFEALEKTIEKMGAEITELGSRSDLNKAQKDKAAEEKFFIEAQKNGVEFDNQLKQDCSAYLHSQIELETLLQISQFHNLDQDLKQKLQDYDNWVKKYSPFVSPASGAMSGMATRMIFR